MKYFGNNKNVNFKLLEESGLYPQELLKQLRIGNYEYITQTLDLDRRENEDFMEPLLYAVRNYNGSYAVFKQYGENLQQADLSLVIDIVTEQPETIEDTAVSSNRRFMLELAEVNPEVIEYMSPKLKTDGEFIKQLCDLNNKEIIEYVAQHTNEFSEEALRTTQEVLRENFNIKVNEECKEEAIRLEKEIEQQRKEGKEPDYRLVAKKTRIEKRPEMLDERLKGLENGDEKAIRYAHRMLKICKNMNENDREMLEQSLKIGEAIAEKQKEEKDNLRIRPEQIEEKTENVRTSRINQTTNEIREEYILETKKKREVEKDDRGTNVEERA